MSDADSRHGPVTTWDDFVFPLFLTLYGLCFAFGFNQIPVLPRWAIFALGVVSGVGAILVVGLWASYRLERGR
jgi:hypothetical protein